MASEIKNAAKAEEVEAFLKELHLKLEFQQVNFDWRDKNLDSYIELSEWGYSTSNIISFLKKLTPKNYSEGPKADNQNIPSKGALWVFGMHIKPRNPKRKKKGKEFYIKVQIGWPDKEVICISFHPSLTNMTYPLATSGNK